MIVSAGGLMAINQAINLHRTESNVQLAGCRALCFLAGEQADEQAFLHLEQDMVALLASESRLNQEQELLQISLKAAADVESGSDPEEILQQMHSKMEDFPAAVRGALFDDGESAELIHGSREAALSRSSIVSSQSSSNSVGSNMGIRRRRKSTIQVSSGRTATLDARLLAGQTENVKAFAEEKLQQIAGEMELIHGQRKQSYDKLISLGSHLAESADAREGFQNWKRIPAVSRRRFEILSPGNEDDMAEVLLAQDGAFGIPVAGSAAGQSSEDLAHLANPQNKRFSTLLPCWAMKGLQSRSRGVPTAAISKKTKSLFSGYLKSARNPPATPLRPIADEKIASEQSHES